MLGDGTQRLQACWHEIKLLRSWRQVRLPFKDLPNGAIEVEDEEGDYCVPARAPGTPPPAAATNSSS